MAHTACLVCFISIVNGHCNKKRKEKKKLTLKRPALVVGTQQTLSNLFWDFWYLWSAVKTTPFKANSYWWNLLANLSVILCNNYACPAYLGHNPQLLMILARASWSDIIAVCNHRHFCQETLPMEIQFKSSLHGHFQSSPNACYSRLYRVCVIKDYGLVVFCSNLVSLGLDHPLDGVTNPKYKLLHFSKNNFL